MSVVVILELKVKDEAYEGMQKGLASILPDTAKFEGCQALHASTDDATKTIMLYEVWDRIESQQKYMGWRQERGELDGLLAALREPLEPRIMNVLPF